MYYVFSWLKKHFIPHESNGHRPHFLRAENTRILILAIILIEGITFLAPTLTKINSTGNLGAVVLPGVLADLTNEERREQNIPALKVNATLTRAAEMKASDMAAKSYFAHTSPEGKTPWYWIKTAGYDYSYAGENLAINFTDSKDVTDAWMNSPTHKANIIKGKYTELGTGVATGIYEGRETVFVAQVYASPAPAPAAVVKTAPAIKTPVLSTVAPKTAEPEVLGAQAVAVSDEAIVIPAVPADPTFIEKAVSSPRNTTNDILFFVLGVVLISLTINMFARMRHVRLDLITNGLLLVAIIGALCIGNYYFTSHNMVVLPTVDTSMTF